MTICTSIRDLLLPQLPQILARRADVQEKADSSYVTAADIYIQALVLDFLKAHHPQYTVISEELPLPVGPRDNKANHIIIDPLDGTENFVSGLKEWGVGVSVYESGLHRESMILLPELGESLITGQPVARFKSRIHGISSSLRKHDLQGLEEGFEYRLMGCSMYNMFNVVRGSYLVFENIKGVNTWDISPGLNLAIEHGCQTYVDGEIYRGELLWPDRKYRVKISNR
jgi:myo-inositol-1(or 4)-monophosphatase